MDDGEAALAPAGEGIQPPQFRPAVPEFNDYSL
jgi:hypothetical protein